MDIKDAGKLLIVDFYVLGIKTEIRMLGKISVIIILRLCCLGSLAVLKKEAGNRSKGRKGRWVHVQPFTHNTDLFYFYLMPPHRIFNILFKNHCPYKKRMLNKC